MKNNLQPLNSTLLAIEKLYPNEKPPTKFDKMIELLKTVSSSTPWGAVGQALEVTGKVCNVMNANKFRAQAVKYVADAYEAKMRAEEEIARARERMELNHSQEKIMTLYIEKAFQTEMDSISKKIILESHTLDMHHQERMAELNNKHELAIRKMDNIAKERLYQIDKTYSAIIRRNETNCLLYRQYLKTLKDSKISPSSMISILTQRYMDIYEKAVLHSNSSPEILSLGLDGTMKILQFLGSPDTFFIPFEKFISQMKNMEDL